MPAIIELDRLVKKYGEHAAVNGVSLAIGDGEIFGLLGPNGAGKSTIVSILGTVLAPTGGDIRVFGRKLGAGSRDIKAAMSIVPQELALYQSLSAKDNLTFFGSLYGLTGRKLRSRAAEVLELIGLKDKADQDVSEYSGGMKRRLNIGIALMNRPRILVLDEPTVGIDPQSRNHILESVRQLNNNEKTTVIYTSHYMEEVELLCGRVGIIDSGRLIALGTKDELKKSINAGDVLSIDCDEDGKAAFDSIKRIKGVANASWTDNRLNLLVSAKDGDLFSIVEQVKQLGIRIKGFHFHEVNLESIFLQITGKSLRE